KKHSACSYCRRALPLCFCSLWMVAAKHHQYCFVVGEHPKQNAKAKCLAGLLFWHQQLWHRRVLAPCEHASIWRHAFVVGHHNDGCFCGIYCFIHCATNWACLLAWPRCKTAFSLAICLHLAIGGCVEGQLSHRFSLVICRLQFNRYAASTTGYFWGHLATHFHYCVNGSALRSGNTLAAPPLAAMVCAGRRRRFAGYRGAPKPA